MNETYLINDLENYAVALRKLAGDSINENSNANLDDYISVGQVCGIIKENTIGISENGKYILDENSHETIFENIITRIYNVGLAKLAANGVIECAWDNESNEMVFWSK